MARLILQYRVDCGWRADDFMVLAAWILYLANGILWSVIYKQMYYVMALSQGTINMLDLPSNIGWIERRYLRGQLAGYLISYTSLWLIKLSFVFFFRNLGNRYRFQRVLWWAVLVFVVACYGATLGVLDYPCEMSNLADSLGNPTQNPSTTIPKLIYELQRNAQVRILSGTRG